jgi:hypothetical protein
MQFKHGFKQQNIKKFFVFWQVLNLDDTSWTVGKTAQGT